jgi:hypothetical protein
MVVIGWRVDTRCDGNSDKAVASTVNVIGD